LQAVDHGSRRDVEHELRWRFHRVSTSGRARIVERRTPLQVDDAGYGWSSLAENVADSPSAPTAGPAGRRCSPPPLTIVPLLALRLVVLVAVAAGWRR
jgi:hypothetical protein